MSDTPHDLPQGGTANPAAEAPAEPAAAPESQTIDPTKIVAEMEAKNVELESQIRDLTDRLLRAHAEMDNIRKRAEREKVDASKYAISKFAREIVGVADNFQRAVSAVPADSEKSGPLQSLLDGVAMTEREFLNVLEKNGVRRVDPRGEAFNPHLHQAVMEQMNGEVPTGTVLQVFQAGYVIEDRVLRPAMVVVSTGGPAAPKEAAPSPEPPPEAANGSNTTT